MGVRGGVSTVAIAAALVVAGCGGSDFKDKPRPAVPLQLTGVIQNARLTISPARHLGAGPFVITISNQTGTTHPVTLEGGQINAEIGSVAPSDTIEIRKTLDPGTYQVRAGSAKAVTKEIEPATLDIGPERADSNNDLLLP
jgi:hypothetical protein